MSPIEMALYGLGAATAIGLLLRWPGRVLGLCTAAVLYSGLGPIWGLWALGLTVTGAVLWHVCWDGEGHGLIDHPRWAAVLLSAVATVLAPGLWVLAGVASLLGTLWYAARASRFAAMSFRDAVRAAVAARRPATPAAPPSPDVTPAPRPARTLDRIRGRKPAGRTGRPLKRSPARRPGDPDGPSDGTLDGVPDGGDLIADQALVMAFEAEEFANGNLP